MSVGENIKYYRKMRNMTQKELGKKLGINSSAVSAFETNKTNMKMSTIQKFAEVFEVNELELAGYIETRSKRVQLLITPSLYNRVKMAAEADGKSVNDTIFTILENHVNKLKND